MGGNMRRKVIALGTLLLAALVIYFLFEKGDDIFPNRANETVWELSPSFEAEEHQFVGQPNKVGIIEAAFTKGKQTGLHWYLWGDQEKLVKGSFKLTASRQGDLPLTLMDHYAIAYGTNGADAQVPSVITIPSSGLWKFDAYVDDEIYGSVVVEVD